MLSILISVWLVALIYVMEIIMIHWRLGEYHPNNTIWNGEPPKLDKNEFEITSILFILYSLFLYIFLGDLLW